MLVKFMNSVVTLVETLLWTHGVRALHASRSRVLVRSRTYLPWRACNFIPRFILHFKCSLKWVTAVKNDTIGQFRERAAVKAKG